jgi:hypothetical protein
MDEFLGSTKEWLVSFYHDFVTKIESVDENYFTNLGLVREDFEYLLDAENSDRLLVKLLDCAQTHPSYFAISDEEILSSVSMGLIIGYTAGLKDTL